MSEKNFVGSDAICCIVEHADIGLVPIGDLSVAQLPVVIVISAESDRINPRARECRIVCCGDRFVAFVDRLRRRNQLLCPAAAWVRLVRVTVA